jgi:hypothetical protein
MSPTVINYVEEYFHTLNPLAKRIVEEINHTRDAYESLWDNLTEPEQRQIVDEAIIRPEAVLQYSRSSKINKELSKPEVYPCFRIQTGAKYVVYEDGTSGKVCHVCIRVFHAWMMCLCAFVLILITFILLYLDKFVENFFRLNKKHHFLGY